MAMLLVGCTEKDPGQAPPTVEEGTPERIELPAATVPFTPIDGFATTDAEYLLEVGKQEPAGVLLDELDPMRRQLVDHWSAIYPSRGFGKGLLHRLEKIYFEPRPFEWIGDGQVIVVSGFGDHRSATLVWLFIAHGELYALDQARAERGAGDDVETLTWRNPRLCSVRAILDKGLETPDRPGPVLWDVPVPIPDKSCTSLWQPWANALPVKDAAIVERVGELVEFVHQGQSHVLVESPDAVDPGQSFAAEVRWHERSSVTPPIVTKHNGALQVEATFQLWNEFGGKVVRADLELAGEQLRLTTRTLAHVEWGRR